MLSKYFSFKGRLNRKPFWLMNLILYVVVFSFLYFVFNGYSNPLGSPPPTVVLLLVLALLIATYISTILIAVRRLHDRNYSGWWALVFFTSLVVLAALRNVFKGAGIIEGIIMFKGAGIIDIIKGAGIMEIVIVFIMIVIVIFYLIELGFRKGTVGPNKYGPEPLSGSVADLKIFGEEKHL